MMLVPPLPSMEEETYDVHHVRRSPSSYLVNCRGGVSRHRAWSTNELEPRDAPQMRRIKLWCVLYD